MNTGPLVALDRAVEVDVYGTCKVAERPRDPLLIERIDMLTLLRGCVELRAPALAGHIDIRLYSCDLRRSCVGE